MDRIVAIILGLIVIIAGFFIVQKIISGTQNIDNNGNAAACTLQGGICKESCALGEQVIGVSCGDARQCCGAPS